jgi:branched-chain amino acid transport system ATP-binding protein
MLEIRELEVRYGAAVALHGVSLELRERRITSIVGSNGAGKSSLLRTIMGHQAPAEGSITFEAREIAGRQAHEVSGMGISLVPEGRRLFTRLTVEENLRLGAFGTKNRRVVDQRLREIFETFPLLLERRNQISGTLSGGEQQVLAIARGLMSKPKLLMLDEPSLGVMPAYVNLVFDVIQRLSSEGTTILLVEQNVERSLYVADHAYVLQTGRIVSEGSGTELLGSDLVRKAYLGL